MYAQFIDDVYTITYDFSSDGLYVGASDNIDVSVTFEDKLFDEDTHYLKASNTFKEQYTFLGWVDENDEFIYSNTTYRTLVKNNENQREVTLYAKYQIEDYTVQYFIYKDNLEEGTGAGAISLYAIQDSNKVYGYLNEYLEFGSRTKETFDTTSLYPPANQISVDSQVSGFTYNEATGNIALDGYEFLGWYAGDDPTEANDGKQDGSVKIESRDIYYEVHGYTEEKAEETIYEKAQLPETVLSLYAQFLPIEYTVYYNKNGFNYIDSIAAANYMWVSGDILPSIEPSVLGKEFVGWSTRPNSSDSDYRLITSGDSFAKVYQEFGNDADQALTLYAQFEDVKYTVTYDFGYNNTYADAPDSVVIEDVLFEDIVLDASTYDTHTKDINNLPQDFIDQYTFILWEDEAGNTIDYAKSVGTYKYNELVDMDDQIREITLYAKHAIIPYAVQYLVYEDLTIMGQSDYEYLVEEAGFYERGNVDIDESKLLPNTEKFTGEIGSYDKNTSIPTIYGYEFLGWYVGEDDDDDTDDTGSGNTNNQKYDGNTLVGQSTSYYEAHGYATLTEAQNAFDTDSLIPETTLSIVAKYRPYTYDIQYDYNDQLAGVVSAPINNVVGVTWQTDDFNYDMSNSDYKKDGYEFVGWYNNKECIGSPITDETPFSEIVTNPTSIKAGDIVTLYAKYQLREYIVHYDLQYDSKMIDETVYWTDGINMTPPERDGYTFTGWWTKPMLADGSLDTSGMMINKDSTITYKEYVETIVKSDDTESSITLYAQWTLILDITLESTVELDTRSNGEALLGQVFPKKAYTITNHSDIGLEMTKIEIEYLSEDWGFLEEAPSDLIVDGALPDGTAYTSKDSSNPDCYIYVTLNGEVLSEDLEEFQNSTVTIKSKDSEVIDVYAEYLLKEAYTEKTSIPLFTIKYYFKAL